MGDAPAGEVELLLFERALEGGAFERCLLVAGGTALAVCRDGAERLVLPLPRGALSAVMRRYGKPLAEALEPDRPVLELASGGQLGRFRHLARFDVIGRDYLLYSTKDSEPLAALAALVTAALRHLASC